MNLCYKNTTLFVNVFESFDQLKMANVEQKIFRILDDYGIHRIIISLKNKNDKEFWANFQKIYYKKYRGYLKIE